MTEEKDINPFSLVAKVYARCKKDKGFAAALKKADNPDTEYQAWEIFAENGIPLDNDFIRIPCALVLAAVAKSSRELDGSIEIGAALARAYQDDKGKDSDAAKMKLRRILACDNVVELCLVLRPILQLISSRGVAVSYAKLLNNLLHFSSEKTLAHWAQDFFGSGKTTEEAS